MDTYGGWHEYVRAEGGMKTCGGWHDDLWTANPRWLHRPGPTTNTKKYPATNTNNSAKKQIITNSSAKKQLITNNSTNKTTNYK